MLSRKPTSSSVFNDPYTVCIQVVLTASRVVEMVRGRKELSTVITGRLGLSLKLGKEFTEAGYRWECKCL